MTLAKPGSGPSIHLGSVSSADTDITVTAAADGPDGGRHARIASSAGEWTVPATTA